MGRGGGGDLRCAIQTCRRSHPHVSRFPLPSVVQARFKNAGRTIDLHFDDRSEIQRVYSSECESDVDDTDADYDEEGVDAGRRPPRDPPATRPTGRPPPARSQAPAQLQ